MDKTGIPNLAVVSAAPAGSDVLGSNVSQVLDSLESPVLCRILGGAGCTWGQDSAGDHGQQYKAFVGFQLLMSSRQMPLVSVMQR